VFSRRTNWKPSANRLTIARQKRGRDILDLTQSNPTAVGIEYPREELAAAMSRAARAAYDPQPLGLLSARHALAAELRCGADDLALTASTSEAYAFLFKLLCNPQDEVLIGTPSYPLLEHLAALELITLRTFPLEFHARWEIDVAALRQAVTNRVRAVVLVNPNNPAGSYVSAREQDEVARLGVPIISDEVFLDYPLEGSGTTLIRQDVLTFTLGGLSKSAGLPHYKLAWIRVSGPEHARRDAIGALELIADSYLSVATPVQAALPDLLRIAPRIRSAISARLRSNLDALRTAIRDSPSARVLPVEGGWSAVLQIPSVGSDEDLAVRLVEEHGVVVHPGYFFDLPGDRYLVLSLLTAQGTFAEGVRRIVGMIPA
jgi:alanine-synthesizing transaminase